MICIHIPRGVMFSLARLGGLAPTAWCFDWLQQACCMFWMGRLQFTSQGVQGSGEMLRIRSKLCLLREAGRLCTRSDLFNHVFSL